VAPNSIGGGAAIAIGVAAEVFGVDSIEAAAGYPSKSLWVLPFSESVRAFIIRAHTPGRGCVCGQRLADCAQGRRSVSSRHPVASPHLAGSAQPNSGATKMRNEVLTPYAQLVSPPLSRRSRSDIHAA
jgi:hypothetical protein